MADEKSEIPALNAWLDELYDTNKYTDEDLQRFYDAYQYQGFNRVDVLRELRRLVPSTDEAVQIIIVCALRGPQRAAIAKLLSGKTIESYRIPASGMKGQKGISCQKITAATADLAAFYLKRMNAPKRLAVECPGYLQFPSAGSIKLPTSLRNQHIEFSRRFSTVIGGVFNEQIYQQMMNNAYLNEKLRVELFGNLQLEVQEVVSVPVAAPSFNPNRGDVGVTKTKQSQKNVDKPP